MRGFLVGGAPPPGATTLSPGTLMRERAKDRESRRKERAFTVGRGAARAHPHHSPLNSNERKELLVGEVPTGEQLFYLSFDEFREWGVVGVGARAPP